MLLQNALTSRQMLVLICVTSKVLKTRQTIGFSQMSDFNISKHTCQVVKSSDEKFVLFYIYAKSMS